jgi:hypothetical protein
LRRHQPWSSCFLGPGFCGRKIRPMVCSRFSTNVAFPIGRPVRSCFWISSQSMSGGSERKLLQSPTIPSNGATVTKASSKDALAKKSLRWLNKKSGPPEMADRFFYDGVHGFMDVSCPNQLHIGITRPPLELLLSANSSA